MEYQVLYDLFLSHNRKQKPWVRELVRFLRAEGVRLFFDEEDILPGEDVIFALEKAIEGSRYVALIISRSSVCSNWVAFETVMRVYDDLVTSRRSLIPILVESVDRCMIRPSVRRLDSVDLSNPETREREFSYFLKSIGISPSKAADMKTWPEPSGIEALFTADINSVISKNWSGTQLLDELIRLDYLMIEGLTRGHEGDTPQWAPVFMDHPDTWRLITNEDQRIVGYWHFVPLFDDNYQRARDGLLMDSEITTDKVKMFELPGCYNIYFVSMGLEPKYRRSRAILLMVKSLLGVLLDLAKDGIFIDEVCANAYTMSGEALCKTFGLKYTHDHIDHGKIYLGRFSDLLNSSSFGDCDELRSLYAGRRELLTDQDNIRSKPS